MPQNFAGKISNMNLQKISTSESKLMQISMNISCHWWWVTTVRRTIF